MPGWLLYIFYREHGLLVLLTTVDWVCRVDLGICLGISVLNVYIPTTAVFAHPEVTLYC